MDSFNRRYSDSEVTNIVKRGLSKRGTNDTISYEDLVEIARRSGLTVEQLENAIDEEEKEGEVERAREIWVSRKRTKFYKHMRSYIIVIGGLLIMNLITRGYPWVLWPMTGWGIGLAFDAADTYFASAERIDRGARWILKRRNIARRIWNESVPESPESS